MLISSCVSLVSALGLKKGTRICALVVHVCTVLLNTHTHIHVHTCTKHTCAHTRHTYTCIVRVAWICPCFCGGWPSTHVRTCMCVRVCEYMWSNNVGRKWLLGLSRSKMTNLLNVLHVKYLHLCQNMDFSLCRSVPITLFTHDYLNQLQIGFVVKRFNCLLVHSLTRKSVPSKTKLRLFT